jgi:hypothetical protein
MAGELGRRREKVGHLFLDQSLLLHRGGKHYLRELVSPRLPVRGCVSVVAAGFLRCVVQLVHHVVNVGHIVQEVVESGSKFRFVRATETPFQKGGHGGSFQILALIAHQPRARRVGPVAGAAAVDHGAVSPASLGTRNAY